MRLSQLRSRYHDQNLSSEEEAFDENNVLRDGKSTRVPMFLMDSKTVVSIDSAQRDADTQKQDAIKRHNAWLKDAWKMKKDKFAGGHGHSKPDPDEEEEEEKSKRIKAAARIPGRDTRGPDYAAYDARQSNAWKNP